MCSGLWFIVSREKRWLSASVTVFPGQCLKTSPTSNSSKYRPKLSFLSWTIRRPRPRLPRPRECTLSAGLATAVADSNA